MRSLFNYRVVAILAVVLALVLFAVTNQDPVTVRPFGSHPVFWVIVVSFAAGIGVGLLGHSLMATLRGHAGRRLEGDPPLMREGDHPGRP